MASDRCIHPTSSGWTGHRKRLLWPQLVLGEQLGQAKKPFAPAELEYIRLLVSLSRILANLPTFGQELGCGEGCQEHRDTAWSSSEAVLQEARETTPPYNLCDLKSQLPRPGMPSLAGSACASDGAFLYRTGRDFPAPYLPGLHQDDKITAVWCRTRTYPVPNRLGRGPSGLK